MNTDEPKVTISDVANLAQVSEATVSRVINNSSSVSSSNRKAVLAAIKELGYIPRRKTSSKLSGHTVLCLGTSYLSNEVELSGHYFPAIIQSLQEECSRRGINLMLMSHGAREDGLKEVRHVIQRGMVDSLVMLYILDPDVIETLFGFDIPSVLLNSYFPWLPIDSVNSDSFSGVLMAMQHLLENGHRRIALISTREERRDYWTRMRSVAYRHALEQAGIAFDPDLVVRGDLNPAAGEESMRELLDRGIPFTAVVCCNDESAFGAMRTLQAAGLRVPEDVSVVGHDDVSATTLVTPALTTVRVSRHDLGRIAIQVLTDRIENPDHAPQHILTAERMIVRDSVRNLNGNSLHPLNFKVIP
jgi:DNA-binding LacI/PurR family transcriptional regulator